jgi:hypothetical protein
MLFSDWDTPLALLKAEVVQRQYEGYTVPGPLKSRIDALIPGKDVIEQRLDQLFVCVALSRCACLRTQTAR